MNALLNRSLIVALAAAGLTTAHGDPAKAAPAPVKPAPARSVFVQPANPREGRDPFFPESVRPYEDARPDKDKTAANAFSVKGMSVEKGRAMVIINNHTFALGDEGDVLTTGGRVHLRLAEIRPNEVVIEVNGARREITITNK